MKLRTERENLTGDDAYFDDMQSLEHDAATAHAKEDAKAALRAEFARIGPTGIAMIAVLDELDRRANALLKQWGFDAEDA